MTKHGKGEALYRSFWDALREIGPDRGVEQARRIQEWLSDHRRDFHPKSFQDHEVFEVYADLQPDQYPVEGNALGERRLKHLEGIWSGERLDDVLAAAKCCLRDLFLCEASLADDPGSCPGCSCDQYFYYGFSVETGRVVVFCDLCGTGVDDDGRKLKEFELRIPTSKELQLHAQRGPR